MRSSLRIILYSWFCWHLAFAGDACAQRYWQTAQVLQLSSSGRRLMVNVGGGLGLEQGEEASLVVRSSAGAYRRVARLQLRAFSDKASVWSLEGAQEGALLGPQQSVVLLRWAPLAKAWATLRVKSRQQVGAFTPKPRALQWQERGLGKGVPPGVDVVLLQQSAWQSEESPAWQQELLGESPQQITTDQLTPFDVDADLKPLAEELELAELAAQSVPEGGQGELIQRVPTVDGEGPQKLAQKWFQQQRREALEEQTLQAVNRRLETSSLASSLPPGTRLDGENPELFRPPYAPPRERPTTASWHELQLSAGVDLIEKTDRQEEENGGRGFSLGLGFEFFLTALDWGLEACTLTPQWFYGQNRYSLGGLNVLAQENLFALEFRYYWNGHPATVGRQLYYLSSSLRWGEARLEHSSWSEQARFDVTVFPTVALGLKGRYPINQVPGPGHFGWGYFASLGLEMIHLSAVSATSSVPEAESTVGLGLLGGIGFFF